MLGSFNGLPYPDSVYNGMYDIYHPSLQPLGHWDFTDISTLYKDTNSYSNQVTANNDLIGRVKNKAYINNPNSNAIGTFMRAQIGADRPTFKTGGANGHSYAEFDSSSGTNLMCNSTSPDYGAHIDNLLSAFTAINWYMSIWVIGEPADNDNDGDEEVVFAYSGYRGEGSEIGTPEDQTTLFTLIREDNEDIHARWKLSGVNPVPLNQITATQTASHWETGAPSIINVTTSMLGYIYNNGVPDTAQVIFSPFDAPFAQEGYATMNYTWDDTKKGTFIIGHNLASNGNLTTDSKGFDGKIYEILMYNFGAPSESQRTAMESYFISKYGI